MKIIADENIPQVTELFGEYGEVTLLPGRTIQPGDVRDADVLLVRSVTPVNASLLQGSSVQFVGSATIGVDHVDMDWLAEQGIAFANAPGCNANGVVDYVFAALYALGVDWLEKTVGIIGCGNVGGRLHGRFRSMGVECHCYDPFLSLTDNPDLTSLQAVLSADIISMHTPYTVAGQYPTHHMLAAEQLAALKTGAVLINAGRGGSIDNPALLALLQQRSDLRVVLDVWESEPEIDLELMDRVALATPHIAGYSVQGKLNGALMVRDAFIQWRKLPVPVAAANTEKMQVQADSVAAAVLAAYDIRADDLRMRNLMHSAGHSRRGQAFDQLRRQYPQRNEYSRYRVKGLVDGKERQLLTALGFGCQG